jgi:hypothetical protein
VIFEVPTWLLPRSRLRPSGGPRRRRPAPYRGAALRVALRNSRRIRSPARTPRSGSTAIVGAAQSASASSPWPGRRPWSAARRRSASSRPPGADQLPGQHLSSQGSGEARAPSLPGGRRRSRLGRDSRGQEAHAPVGDRRQYIGNAEGVENSQVSLHLVEPGGTVMARRAVECASRDSGPASQPSAGRPGADTAFATKPEPAVGHFHTFRRNPARRR